MNYVMTVLITLTVLLMAIVLPSSHALVDHLRNENRISARLPQVLLLPSDTRSAVIRDYVRQIPERADVLILGDSQTYGNGLPPEESLGAYLGRHNRSNVFNMSVIDARHSDQQKILRILKEERKRFNFVVLNINPSHFKQGISDPHHVPDAGGHSLPLALSTTSEPGIYQPPFLDRIQKKNVYSLDLYDKKKQNPVTGFNARLVGKDYYAGLDPAATHEIVTTLSDAAEIADRVVAFAAPTSYAVYNKPPYSYGWDTRPTVSAAMAHCRLVARVICLDLSSSFPHEFFMDVVHLNPDGTRLLAEKISQAMRGIR